MNPIFQGNSDLGLLCDSGMYDKSEDPKENKNDEIRATSNLFLILASLPFNTVPSLTNLPWLTNEENTILIRHYTTDKPARIV